MHCLGTSVAYCARRRALTLIELGVGIMTLITLAATALPAVRSARQSSLVTHCQSNLGRIQAAALIYSSEDANELIIPIGPGDANSVEIYTSSYGYGGRSGRGSEMDVNQSPFGGSPLYQMGTPHRPLNRILFKQRFPGGVLVTDRSAFEDWSSDARWDVGVYNCPADNGFPGMHHQGWKQSGRTSYDYYGTSYAANALFVGTPASQQPLYSFSAYGRPVSSVPVPSLTVAYQENAARFAIFANNPNLDQTECSWPFSVGAYTAHGWHNQDFRFNVAFIDGSVRFEEIRGFGRQSNVTCTPGGPYPCQCVAVRTANWRMDVAPAPFVVVGKTSCCYGGAISIGDGWGASFFIVQ
jgi:prepilin-type processing-associated H-X9-DG protein